MGDTPDRRGATVAVLILITAIDCFTATGTLVVGISLAFRGPVGLLLVPVAALFGWLTLQHRRAAHEVLANGRAPVRTVEACLLHSAAMLVLLVLTSASPAVIVVVTGLGVAGAALVRGANSAGGPGGSGGAVRDR